MNQGLIDTTPPEEVDSEYHRRSLPTDVEHTVVYHRTWRIPTAPPKQMHTGELITTERKQL